MKNTDRGFEIKIKGLVQGVGFRPFIYSLANSMNLKGTVENTSSGVLIKLQCSVSQIEKFMNRLRIEKPSVAHITDINLSHNTISSGFHDFRIVSSSTNGSDVTYISPDMSVCQACMDDYEIQPHRIHYPFINCTHCGPRFSIINSIPYDRPFTTMRYFDMCNTCKDEYTNVSDRRFHAQPIACNHCGPTYRGYLKRPNKEIELITSYKEILEQLIKELEAGHIVALKGIGGFNWWVDARNKSSVKQLRVLKNRPNKPFALMAKDIEWVKQHMSINDQEQKTLLSWRKPIVVLDEKIHLNDELNKGFGSMGVMLPYQPIHFDLFKHSHLDAIVVTSANKIGEPMLCNNAEAREYLIEKSDFYIEHNREIYNRVDDSVVQEMNRSIHVIRRARGYVPEPILNIDNTEGGVAFGAEMTAVFAIGKGEQILMGQYIGNLSNLSVYEAYQQSLQQFIHLFKLQASFLVADAHPDYYSSKWAHELAKAWNLPLYKVQHHHAHAVAVMVEHHLMENCIALILDGTGYGDDNQSWGGELLLCNRTCYERISHLPYQSLPGADKASYDCGRMTLSYFYGLYGTFNALPHQFVKRYGESKIKQIEMLLASPLNKYQTSSAGRLFDAIAALLDICTYNSFQGEAPMKLEQAAYSYRQDMKSYFEPNKDQNQDWNLKSIFHGILHDLEMKCPVGLIAMRFHRSIALQLSEVINRYAMKHGIRKIVISGGVFQNRLLFELLINEINGASLEVYYPINIPCNDGGIAVGQLAIAAAIRKQE